MTIIKTKEEIKIVREAGKRLSFVLREVVKAVAPGVTTKSLDEIAESLIREKGDTPAFLGYTPDGSDRPYPATLCVSINNEVVHGIPRGDRILKDGDIVGLDLGLRHRGFYSDTAITVPVGKVSVSTQKLLKKTEESLMAGIRSAKAGKRIGDISEAIQKIGDKNGYGIVRILGGHGIGKNIHEKPYVPNFGRKGTGPVLEEGMLLAIEPMFNVGDQEVYLDQKDGYTYKTSDGELSAHFEHTILINKKEAEILTI